MNSTGLPTSVVVDPATIDSAVSMIREELQKKNCVPSDQLQRVLDRLPSLFNELLNELCKAPQRGGRRHRKTHRKSHRKAHRKTHHRRR